MTSDLFSAKLPRGWSIAIALLASGLGVWAIVYVQSLQQTRRQCQQIVDRVNRGYTQAIAFQGSDATALNSLADDLGFVARDLRSLDLSRPALQQQRRQFVQAYGDLSDAYRNMSDALIAAEAAPTTEAGLQQVKQAQSSVKIAGSDAYEAAQRIDELSLDLNRICAAGR